MIGAPDDVKAAVDPGEATLAQRSATAPRSPERAPAFAGRVG